MLTQAEDSYLQKIPESKIVRIKPYNPNTFVIADAIIKEIHLELPSLEVVFLGASALGISGQGDIDIYVFCEEKDFARYISNLEKLFGPQIPEISSNEWQFEKRDFKVAVYLTNPTTEAMQRQIAVFETLNNNKSLLQEYERLKERFNGKSYRDYQRAKYEFYSRILGGKTL